MKITFVMPGVGKQPNGSYVKSWLMEPLAFAVLAGLTPDHTDVRFIDDRLDKMDYAHDTDLVAINVETYTAKRAYHIAEEFRKKGKKVIFGGYHPTLFSAETVQHADAIVVGEVESIWADVLEDAKNGVLKQKYESLHRPGLIDYSITRNIYQEKNYLPICLIETARGCKYSCDFCSISSFYHSSYRARKIDGVVEEIKRLGKKTYFFVDDNIAADPERSKALFEELIPLNITWFGQGCIDVANDPELLKLMKKSGCAGLLIGFESLNGQNLSRMKKTWALKHNNYESSIKKIHEQGISIYATFMFGYDDDDPKTIERTLAFAIKQKFFMAAFNHLVPFPGTNLYAQLDQQNRLLYPKWWLEKNYRFGDVAFAPKHFTPEQLRDHCFRARKDFFQTSSILIRSTNFLFNRKNLNMLFQYFYLNVFSLNAVRQRQGLSLGAGLQ